MSWTTVKRLLITLNRNYKLYEIVFHSDRLASFNRAIADRHLRTVRVIQRSQAETKRSFNGRSPKWRRTTASGRAMILRRSLRVWSLAMKQSYLAKYNATQCNAIRIRHRRRHRRCHHRYVNGDCAATSRVAEMRMCDRSIAICKCERRSTSAFTCRRRYRNRRMELVKHIGRFLISWLSSCSSRSLGQSQQGSYGRTIGQFEFA